MKDQELNSIAFKIMREFSALRAIPQGYTKAGIAHYTYQWGYSSY